jgi:hypothetical protein
MTRRRKTLAAIATLLLAAACTPDQEQSATQPDSATEAAPKDAPNPLRNAYFGDTHVHTFYSFDAYVFNVRASPDDAYRYAKGEAIDHASGHRIQLGTPLDFQAVSDHAFYLGVLPAMQDPDDVLYQTPLAQEFRELDSTAGFQRALQAIGSGELAALDSTHATRGAWERIVEAAERHNDPGKFTTFIGWEYTASAPDRGNLHRNVIFRGSDVPPMPFSSGDSQDPEDLWRWLDERRAEGMEAMAIPHNSNGSNGHMFQLETVSGEPIDAEYAELRMRNEPLVEATQVKGDSETHPLLSPNDEWADFETFPYRIATQLYSEPKGGYVREAYLNGLVLEETQGFNPFRFGLIGATDTHNAGGTPEEDNFHGKVGDRDGTPQRRGSVPLDEAGPDGSAYSDGYFQYWAGAGLAGVWAEENTRESLYDAMRRKETYATTGPRMLVRLFAGYDYADGLATDPDMIAKAYAGGVPMGADLGGDRGREPRFLIWGARDPNSAPLQRLQIVKGWVEDGEAREAVYDAVCSDGLEVDPQSHRCESNGASVDLSDCRIPQDLGASELSTLWTDPDFDAGQRAFYYVRLLENPSCRWSTWDAIRAGVAPRDDVPATIQERAYTSPIWYTPAD